MEIRSIAVWIMLSVAALAAGCGGGDMPPAPTPTVTTSSTVTPSATATLPATATATPPPTATSSLTPADPLLVITDRGAVRGAAADGVRQFLGIPYAAAPIGAQRWRPPAAHEAWSGVLDATQPGSACPQILQFVDLRFGAEDCLFLNVVTPDPVPVAPAPVMVWIHGGAFTAGIGRGLTGASQGDVIARTAGAVVVSFNYRLGQLGFLAHPALRADAADGFTSGNYGFEDQIAALRWVRDNIAAFGGDPNNVTIFGESAGGWSVCLHLASPASAGLFQHAVVESGLCIEPLPDLAAAERQGLRFAELAGCAGTADVAACLRAQPVDVVIDTLPADPNVAFTDGEWGFWSPIVDGEVLPAAVADTIAAGSFNRVPVLIGSNADEGTSFVALGFDLHGTPLQADQYRDRLLSWVRDPAAADAISARYPLSAYATPGAALAAAFGDGYIACPTLDAATLLSSRVPTYLYQFTYPHAAFIVPPPVPLGAFHAAEIQFVFGVPAGPGFTDSERALSDQMLGYWTRFADSGNPNRAGAPTWPPLDAQARYLDLDLTIGEGRHAKQEVCDFWRTLAFDRNPTM